ncbi:MAG: RDD family protein [Casimicrobiaceae bacterium]
MSGEGGTLAGAPTASALRPASVRRRLAALVYEALLLAAVLFIAGFVLLPLTPRTPGATTIAVPGPPVRAASFGVVVAVLGLYCTWFWSRGRRTLAMKTWQLRLVTDAGVALASSQALRRYLAGWIGPALALATYLPLHAYAYAGADGRWALAFLGVNFAWAAVDRDRKFLHDRLAGTRLLDDRRAPAPAVPAHA